MRAAAERGHREAAYRLARALDRTALQEQEAGADNGVEPSAPEEAEQWYRQAAARGHRRAALHLGAILRSGAS